MEGGNIENVEKDEYKEEEYKEDNEHQEDDKDEYKEEEYKEDNEHQEDDKNENSNEDSNEDTNEDSNEENNNILNGGGKKKTKNEEEQDLENPARKTAFEKSSAKNNTENIKEEQDEEDTNTNDIEYAIDYLIEDDEKLINVDNVKNLVDTYIDNYNSESMKKYRLSFNKLYQKYSNKKYKIKLLPVNDKYKSTKIVVFKNDKKEDTTIITELIKPHYIYYDNDTFNLYDFKNKVSNVRAELLYKYEILVSKLNISPEEKTNFEKERTKFVKLLEDYYSYTLYHKKINKIATLNTTQLIVQSKYNIVSNDTKDNKDSSEDMISILSGETYTINNDIINSININNIDKLTHYNSIILQLTGKNSKDIRKDTKLIEEMKLYLNKSEKEKCIKQIEESKTKQDTYINYIVSRLPIT